MAKRKSNRYAKKTAKKNILATLKGGLNTKGDIKNSLLETGKDLVVGVLAGGLVGAAIGKPSLLIGIAVTGVGHFTGHRLASLFGVGVMAANGFQNKSLSGVDGLSVEAVKERMAAYKDNFAQKLYLDAVMKKVGGTNGIGALQYFNYPSQGGYDELNGELAALDSIERQIEESGMSHMQMTGMGSMDGAGLADIGDYNL